jgi:cytochrome d ubiquinol oxidase subunit II
MFSGFYLALLLILFFLIVRVVSFEWRDKSESPRWRRAWMWANAGGSAGIALVWGIAFANLIQGVALDSKHDYTGNLADLFTGYTVFAGLALVIVFAFHGANFLTLRTAGDLCERAQRAAAALAVPAVAAGAAFLIWTVVVAVDHNDKGVFPPIVPAVIGIAALVLAAGFVYLERSGVAFTLTALGVVSTVATLFTSLYPRVMVSDPNFGNSLTVSNAASAHYTLVVLTVVAAIVTPLVLLYQGWTYYVFRARVTGEEVESPDALIGAPSGSRAR